MKTALAYFFPVFLFGLLIKFGDIGERGMILILLYAVLVLLYLLVFGIRQLWRKEAPPLNAVTIVCWLTITFFFAQALPSL